MKATFSTDDVLKALESHYLTSTRTRIGKPVEVRRFADREPCVAPSTAGLSITLKDGSIYKIAILRYELPK